MLGLAQNFVRPTGTTGYRVVVAQCVAEPVRPSMDVDTAFVAMDVDRVYSHDAPFSLAVRVLDGTRCECRRGRVLSKTFA